MSKNWLWRDTKNGSPTQGQHWHRGEEKVSRRQMYPEILGSPTEPKRHENEGTISLWCL